ncbi:MAG TPA: pallilysin-related adhesin [Spirochaetia bacterium]|nr:pallilysin-related adhesin [Spirochaetales bacterium]HRY81510.1 pallilysin-related adhesin [Spirochaetia bacterium]
MKRATQILFLLCSIAAAGYIVFLAVDARSSRSQRDDKPMLARSVAAEPRTEEGGAEGASEERARTVSEIPTASNEILLDVYSFNLDSDQEDEQILVVRRTDDPSGLLRLIVADYLPGGRSWVRAWEGSTAVTKVRTLQILVKDVVGDHIPNIIAVGMNDRGEQAVSIFWRTPPSREYRSPLFYTKICEVSGDSVTIEETERPESYKLGQTNAETWPVTVHHRDPESENFLDQIRETWEWNFTRKAYERVLVERIPGAQIERQLVTRILDGTVETFQRYLEGIWYRASADPRAPGSQFVIFDPREKTLSFFSDNVMEPYQWEDSHPTRYGIFIGSRSSAVKTLRRLIDVELTGHEAVSLRIFQDIRLKADVTEQWNGTYRKMNSELASSFRKVTPVTQPRSAPLSGRYRGLDGSTLSFDPPRFTAARDGRSEAGGFSVFTLKGAEILEMKYLTETGVVGKRVSYRVDRSQRKENGETVEILNLTPVRVAIDGIEFVEGSPLILERLPNP